jgi:2-polyprenyl-6-methoxyphenol hydroxylase-like FAD-dependent oxidoreductase
VLHEAVSKIPNIKVHFRETVNAIEERPDGTVTAHLRSGGTEEADLMVGADGIHSQVRRLIMGEEASSLRYLGYHTCAYLIDEPELRSMVNERCLIICAPGKQLALYPTRSGQLAAWLIHVSADAAIPDDPQARVRAEYADLIQGNSSEAKIVKLVLELCPDPGPNFYYDQVSQIELDEWSKGPVVLLGDACQAVSLMAGQGASMAMGSAWVLADELRKAKGNPAEAAKKYHQRLQSEIRDIQRTGRTSARWLVPTANWQLLVRRVVFSITAFPWLGYILQPLVAPFQKSVVNDSP